MRVEFVSREEIERKFEEAREKQLMERKKVPLLKRLIWTIRMTYLSERYDRAKEKGDEKEIKKRWEALLRGYEEQPE